METSPIYPFGVFMAHTPSVALIIYAQTEGEAKEVLAMAGAAGVKDTEKAVIVDLNHVVYARKASVFRLEEICSKGKE